MAWYDSLLHPALSSVRAYRPAAAAHPNPVRLDANESPWALSPTARERLSRELLSTPMHRYPDVRAADLRAALAAHQRCDPEQLVLGAGSDEPIALTLLALSRAAAGHARAVLLVPEPTFVMYRVSAALAGMDTVSVPLDGQWQLDVEVMLAAIELHEPNVVVLASPNNPTAACFESVAIERLAVATAGRSLLLLDEAYGAYAERNYHDLAERYSHVGRLGTLSKVGLAGLRVGWAQLPAGLAAEVDKVRQPYNLNTFSQRAATLCLTELAPEFEAAVARVRAERSALAEGLAALPGCRVWPSDANFLWVELARDAGVVHSALATRGVLVRSFHERGGRLASMLRITVGTPDEDRTLLRAMGEVLAG